MMYACEMMTMITEKKAKEEAERKEREAREKAEKLAKALQNFYNNLKAIDVFVEEQIFKGEGKAKILIEQDFNDPDDFYYFAKKDWRYSTVYPYWNNQRVSTSFPLETYVAYLRDHCYTVEVIKEPFKAYSSTFKSDRIMEGLTLSISID